MVKLTQKLHFEACFPNQQTKVKLSDFTELPTIGIYIKSTNPNTVKGFEVGDVIVALDGIRVENLAQYYYIRDSKAEDPKTG